MFRRLRGFRGKRGFTLVELMIVVAIIGILAALAIYGVKKYLTNAKTGEAKNNLGRLGKDAVSAYEREVMDGDLLAKGGDETKSTHRLCIKAEKTVPATVPKGTKMQPSPSDWNVGDNITGWKCLRFSVNDPLYYAYGYSSDADEEKGGTEFEVTASGDLDADETASVWTYKGGILEGAARLAPTVIEPDDPEE